MRLRLFSHSQNEHGTVTALILSIILVSASTGCVADKVADRFAVELIKRSLLGDTGVLVACTQMFRESKRRLPASYDELREFTLHKFHGEVQLPHYDHVDFKQRESGQLQLDCFVIDQGVTNSTTFTFGVK